MRLLLAIYVAAMQSACTPFVEMYNTEKAAFEPRDPCQHSDVMSALLTGLHKTKGMEKADFQNVTSSTGFISGMYACHGTLVLENGARIPGTVTIGKNDSGSLYESWVSDADKNAQEQQEKSAERDRFNRWSTAHGGLSYADYLQQLSFCQTYRSWAYTDFNLKQARIPKDIAIRNAQEESARESIGVDPLTAIDAEKLQMKLLDIAYSTGGTVDEFAAQAFSSCMDHGGL